MVLLGQLLGMKGVQASSNAVIGDVGNGGGGRQGCFFLPRERSFGLHQFTFGSS